MIVSSVVFFCWFFVLAFVLAKIGFVSFCAFIQTLENHNKIQSISNCQVFGWILICWQSFKIPFISVRFCFHWCCDSIAVWRWTWTLLKSGSIHQLANSHWIITIDLCSEMSIYLCHDVKHYTNQSILMYGAQMLSSFSKSASKVVQMNCLKKYSIDGKAAAAAATETKKREDFIIESDDI